MGNYFTPLVVWVLSILAVATTAFTVFHHEAVNGEDNKIQVHTDAVKQNVGDQNNAIINMPRTDARSIDRLQHATFFPTR